MGAAFTILAFFTVLGLVTPFVAANVPFAAAVTPVSNPLPVSVYQGNAGCTVSTGNVAACNATVSAGPGGGIFGSVVSGTLLVFGNFFAALQYLANLGVGMVLPYSYVYHWLAWSDSSSVTTTAAAIAAMVNVLVWVAYANDFFYIVSGRWIFP